jgi:hypothetical protein
MDENKSRVFGLFDRTAIGVVEDDIISNRQSGHCGISKRCLDISPLKYISMRQRTPEYESVSKNYIYVWFLANLELAVLGP